MYYKYVCIVSSTLLLINMTACSKKDVKDAVIITQLDDLLTESSHPCKDALLSAASDLILDKEHFLTLASIPSTVEIANSVLNADSKLSKDDDEKKLNIEKTHFNSPLIANGLLEYKDRPAHVRFSATNITHVDSSDTNIDTNVEGKINNKTNDTVEDAIAKQSVTCLVSYQLDYHFDEPCISIREDAFKKWNQLEVVNNKQGQTRYFQHMRKPNKKAFLTNLSRNAQCLVSVQELQTLSVSNVSE